jgi:hypothetical protein
MQQRWSEISVGWYGRFATFCLIWMGLLGGNVSATTITFQSTSLGTMDGSGRTLFRIVWTVQGHMFLTNQELDIQFDPASYGALSNGVTPAGFNVQLLQTDNPPGAFGDFSALALVDNPSLAGGFMVDVFSLGQPINQPWTINQLDQHGVIVSVVDSGATLNTTIPEPSTLLLVGLTLLGVWSSRSRTASGVGARSGAEGLNRLSDGLEWKLLNKTDWFASAGVSGGSVGANRSPALRDL